MPLAEELGIESVEDVIRNIFGISGTADGDEFRVLCPVHEQDGVEHSPSCDVNLVTGQWNCFSCSASSDIIGLGKIVLHKSRKEVLDLLRPNEPGAVVAAVRNRVKTRLRSLRLDESKVEAVKLVNGVPPLGSYEKGPLSAAIDRGFLKSTLRKWGVRFVPSVELAKSDGKTFTLRNNLAIPIVDSKGDVACWVYRATADSDTWQIENAKYVYTPGLVDVLNQNWFGLYEHRKADEIVVVEGSLDTMWLDQAGVPAVGMLGTNSKQFAKVELLTDFRRVTLLPDRDIPGLTAALKLGDRLQSYGTPVKIALYREWMTNPKGEPASDPQELHPMDLELALATALPWQVWRRQPGVQQLANEIRRKTEGKQVGSERSPRRSGVG